MHRAHHPHAGSLRRPGPRVLRAMLPPGLQNAQAAYTHAA